MDINLYTTQLTNIPFGGFDRKFPGSCEDLGEREDCCCHLRWTFWGIGDDQHRNNTILSSGVERIPELNWEFWWWNRETPHSRWWNHVKSPFLLLNPQFYLMFKAIWTQSRGCGRCGTCGPWDPHLEAGATSAHHSAVWDHRDASAIVTCQEVRAVRAVTCPILLLKSISCPTKSQNTQHVNSVDIFGFQFQYVYIYIYIFIHSCTYIYVRMHTHRPSSNPTWQKSTSFE